MRRATLTGAIEAHNDQFRLVFFPPNGQYFFPPNGQYLYGLHICAAKRPPCGLSEGQFLSVCRGSEEFLMGKNDSSKTRIQPIFDALYRSDPRGKGWLDRLLTIGGRMPVAQVGLLMKPPNFEFLVPPSKGFLRWLEQNPQRWPSA